MKGDLAKIAQAIPNDAHGHPWMAANPAAVPPLPERRSCTLAVVCWLWCLEHTAYQQGGTPARGPDPYKVRKNGIQMGTNGTFEQFIVNNRLGTQRFIIGMADAKGKEKWFKNKFLPDIGWLVLFYDGDVFAHVAVFCSGNTLNGYNQGGGYYAPPDAAHALIHSTRPWAEINWGDRLQSRTVYTISENKARMYFREFHDDFGKW